MKRIKLLIILFGIIAGIVTAYILIGTQKTAISVVSVNNESKKEITRGIPKRIIIEKLQIDAPVEEVGLDKEGNMDVPQNSDNGGWFSKGYRPGDAGNAVIAGHLDKVTGAPAVFYRLSQLELGDVIKITDDKGNVDRFSVVNKNEYPYTDFPLQEVFGSTEKRRLNLITCNGVFDYSKKTYLKRLVVYSELLQ